MMRRAHFAGIAMLIALAVAPVCGAATASVSGVVRDSSGVPQIGAEVQLLRSDLSVAASVYTNGQGRFKIASVMPGRYSLKAMGMSYLPALRENVRVRTGTVVNLTLNTLYEVMQWLPAEPRAGNAQQDDWAWTLRSAANRPLLRWLEDGPLVVVTEGSASTPKLKARLMATGQEGTFGESGQRFSVSVEDTPSSSRELLARVDFAPNTDEGLESMLGFRQDLGFAGSVQTLAAIAIHPGIDGPGGNAGPSGAAGLDEAAIRTWETMHLGDEFDIEVGSTQVVGHFAGPAGSTVVAALPNASVDWRGGNNTVGYKVATMLSSHGDGSEAGAWLPKASLRQGELVLERGMHHEIGWRRTTDASSISIRVFSDSIQNPVLDARAHKGTANAASFRLAGLYDNGSGLLRTSGRNFSSQGVVASVEHRLPGGNNVRLTYANGHALVVPVLPRPAAIVEALGAAHPRRAQMYSIALSGTLDGTGTRWRASYRWQPDDTVTEIAPFAQDASSPYLNLRLRQPIRLHRDGSSGFEALVDVRNMLAQGYRPVFINDGSVLIFAQDQRSIRGGLAFTF